MGLTGSPIRTSVWVMMPPIGLVIDTYVSDCVPFQVLHGRLIQPERLEFLTSNLRRRRLVGQRGLSFQERLPATTPCWSRRRTLVDQLPGQRCLGSGLQQR